MGCALHQATFPLDNGVRVNGVEIARALIAAEVQHHQSLTPAEAWKSAVRALVVRELLLQEARRLGIVARPLQDTEGRRETDEEAAIRELLTQEVRTPNADAEDCRRYYERNQDRFRSPDIYEAAHILFAAASSDLESYEQARAAAIGVIATLADQPEHFADVARAYSACPSGAHGGNLGQITAGQTTAEFERALVSLEPSSLSREPVATRYGFHVIRLDRKLDGRTVPFELVADRIARYLQDSVQRRATAQYIALLASSAYIEGMELANTEALQVS